MLLQRTWIVLQLVVAVSLFHFPSTLCLSDGTRSTSPLLSVTSAGFANVPYPTCDDGTSRAPQPLMWNILYEPYSGTSTPRGNDLSKLGGTSAGLLLCVYPVVWNNYTTDLSHRGWPTSVSAVWPSLAGPWCDKTKDPNCKPEYIKNNGGCPQAVDMTAHKAALKVGLDAQVPLDFTGYVSYDFEGWDPVLISNNSGYAEECGGVDKFEAAAKEYFTITIATVKSLRPKAKFGFYGRPMNSYGGRSYDYGCPNNCINEYTTSLRAYNDKMLWFFKLVDYIQPTLYLDTYQPNGTNATWPHRTDFVRATMRECERISNLTGGKPILPQSNYQYFGIKGWPFMNITQDITDALLAPFEFPHTVGVGVWSDDDAQGQPSDRNEQNQRFIDETLSPIINEFTSKSCGCRKTKCNNHGRCYLPLTPYPIAPTTQPTPPPPQASSSFASTTPTRITTESSTRGEMFGDDSLCFCDDGYTGIDCSAHVQNHTVDSAADVDIDVGGDVGGDGVGVGGDGVGVGGDGVGVGGDGVGAGGGGGSSTTAQIVCPDGRSTCPNGSTCAAISTGAWGCCATPNAVLCDLAFCCPKGFSCALSNNNTGTATHCEQN